jgi:hypothetical protein
MKREEKEGLLIGAALTIITIILAIVIAGFLLGWW